MSFSTILHKRNSVAGVVPSLTSLSAGELAINTADGKIFTKTVGNTIESFLNAKQLPYVLDASLSSVNFQYGGNTVTGILAGVLGGIDNDVSGAGSTVVNGSDNDIEGDYAFIGNGSNNKILSSGDFGAILGGQNNTLDHQESFILGSNITSHLSGVTYVNNLSATGKLYGDGSEITGIVEIDTSVSTLVRSNSGDWDSTYTTVESNSANWTDLTTFNTPSSYPYTLTLTDRSKMMLVDSPSTTNVLVPNDTTYNLPIGAEIKITAMGTGYVDIIGESGVSIKREGATLGAGISNRIINQYSTVSILKLSANTWLMGGNVVSVYNSPLALPGVELWLDAADNTTLFDAVTGGSTPAGNGTIARWEDKSSNANHATQSVVNSRPIRLISELNGLDGIDFDGTDDRFIVSSPVTDGPFTVFCVMKVDVITSGYQRMLHMFGPTATHNFMLMVSNAGAYLTRDQRGQADSYAINKNWGTLGTNTPYILTAIFKETPQNVTGYINNLLGVGADISGGNSVGAGPPTIIGARTDLLTSTHFSGKLFELIVYNKELNDAEKNGIYAYLAEKWY